MSLWEYPGDHLPSTWIQAATAGLPPSPKAPLSHGETHAALGANSRVTDNVSESWPESRRGAELLLSRTLAG